MEGLSEIIRTITGEMQKSLSARTVVGDPITIEGKTIVPLVSVGMGFGAGTGSGKEPASGGGGGGACCADVFAQADTNAARAIGAINSAMREPRAIPVFFVLFVCFVFVVAMARSVAPASAPKQSGSGRKCA